MSLQRRAGQKLLCSKSRLTWALRLKSVISCWKKRLVMASFFYEKRRPVVSHDCQASGVTFDLRLTVRPTSLHVAVMSLSCLFVFLRCMLNLHPRPCLSVFDATLQLGMLLSNPPASSFPPPPSSLLPHLLHSALTFPDDKVDSPAALGRLL